MKKDIKKEVLKRIKKLEKLAVDIGKYGIHNGYPSLQVDKNGGTYIFTRVSGSKTDIVPMIIILDDYLDKVAYISDDLFFKNTDEEDFLNISNKFVK